MKEFQNQICFVIEKTLSFQIFLFVILSVSFYQNLDYLCHKKEIGEQNQILTIEATSYFRAFCTFLYFSWKVSIIMDSITLCHDKSIFERYNYVFFLLILYSNKYNCWEMLGFFFSMNNKKLKNFQTLLTT